MANLYEDRSGNVFDTDGYQHGIVFKVGDTKYMFGDKPGVAEGGPTLYRFGTSWQSMGEFSNSFVPANIKTQNKEANYTLTVADSGVLTKSATDTVVFTLPPTAVGLTFTIMNMADGTAGISVSPNAADKIMGGLYTAVDDKDITNTKATAKRGDYVTLVGDGVDGWYIQSMVGTWAYQG